MSPNIAFDERIFLFVSKSCDGAATVLLCSWTGEFLPSGYPDALAHNDSLMKSEPDEENVVHDW